MRMRVLSQYKCIDFLPALATIDLADLAHADNDVRDTWANLLESMPGAFTEV